MFQMNPEGRTSHMGDVAREADSSGCVHTIPFCAAVSVFQQAPAKVFHSSQEDVFVPFVCL